MQQSQDLDNIINTLGSPNPRWAAIDAQQRNRQALQDNGTFFNSAQHQARISAVQDIVEGFFSKHGGVYVNHRPNRGQPFTVVKVERPVFPAVSQARKKRDYIDPLRALGVEIVLSSKTNSYLYRIR